MKNWLFICSVCLIVSVVGSSCKARDVHGPDGALSRALAWSTMGFDDNGQLLVLTLSPVEMREPGRHQIVRWSFDETPSEVLWPIDLDCHLQDTRYGIHVIADSIYVITRCLFSDLGQIHVGVSGGTFSKIAEFDARGSFDHWFIGHHGHLTRFVQLKVWEQKWRRTRYSASGLQSDEEVVFLDNIGLHNKFRVPPPASGIIELSESKALCFFQSPFASDSAHFEALGEGYNPVRVKLPHEWLVTWVIDFEEQMVKNFTVSKFAEIQFGTMEGWLHQPSYEVLNRTTNAIPVLIQGGVRIRFATPDSEFGDPLLHLVRFDESGSPLSPSVYKSLNRLKASIERISSPSKRIIRTIPEDLGGDLLGYQLLELDDKQNMSVIEFRSKR